MVPPITSPPALEVDDLVPWVSLLCPSCDVTWRGRPMVPCWACGDLGVRAAFVTTVVD